MKKIEVFNKNHPEKVGYRLDEKSAILITYPDSIVNREAPLKTLKGFLSEYIGDAINTIHILPFFPYSSDDGFSVIDYKRVNPSVGTWEDVNRLSEEYYLMFDAVINHISAKSKWFRAFLDGSPRYRDYFITEDPETDLSGVTRPRALPLLTEFETSDGKQYLWTTFSEDQIDLNFKSAKLFLEITDTLIFYVKNGASLIRLDAIGYLWKEIGTKCIHHRLTHEIVKLFRDILDALNKTVLIVTETNVPHHENISYFGNGHDEAHMVYNFSLPPLIMNAYLQRTSIHLEEWIQSLDYPSDDSTFFNFLASHDGIGIMPVKGMLDQEEINALIERTENNGGQISYKTNQDGTKSPYELNINYFDALYNESSSLKDNILKFIGAYCIAFSLKGIPGLYIHSLLGSRNWYRGVEITGQNRAINREKLQYDELTTELNDQASFRSRIFRRMKALLGIRKEHNAFSPLSEQRVIPYRKELLILERCSDDETIFCIVNLSSDEFQVNIEEITGKSHVLDLITRRKFETTLTVLPYEYLWLQ